MRFLGAGPEPVQSRSRASHNLTDFISASLSVSHKLKQVISQPDSQPASQSASDPGRNRMLFARRSRARHGRHSGKDIRRDDLGLCHIWSKQVEHDTCVQVWHEETERVLTDLAGV